MVGGKRGEGGDTGSIWLFLNPSQCLPDGSAFCSPSDVFGCYLAAYLNAACQHGQARRRLVLGARVPPSLGLQVHMHMQLSVSSHWLLVVLP